MFVKFETKTFSVDSFYSKIFNQVRDYEFESFSLGVTYPKDLDDEKKEKLKTDFQKNLTVKIAQDLNKKIDFDYPDMAIIIDFSNSQIEYIIRPIFVYGKYNKYSRELAQTYHFCYKCRGKGCDFCNRTGKLSESSVEEILIPYFITWFGGKDAKFHGAGREDKDVRMLGTGRPFVMQVVDPQKRKIKKEELKKLETKINSKEKNIKIKLIRLITKKEMGEITSAEHNKLYSAIVSCDSELTQKELENIKGEYNVDQRTPNRVSKRRVDLVRKKYAKIKKVNLKINKKEFRIWIESDAGLYIKEFISGDEGRSNPSISGLLKKKCTCKVLDVLRIV